jgi:hypothetical protein
MVKGARREKRLASVTRRGVVVAAVMVVGRVKHAINLRVCQVRMIP